MYFGQHDFRTRHLKYNQVKWNTCNPIWWVKPTTFTLRWELLYWLFSVSRPHECHHILPLLLGGGRGEGQNQNNFLVRSWDSASFICPPYRILVYTFFRHKLERGGGIASVQRAGSITLFCLFIIAPHLVRLCL